MHFLRNEQDPERLDAFLEKELPCQILRCCPPEYHGNRVSRSKIRRLILSGVISSGKRTLRSPAWKLHTHDTLTIHFDPGLFFQERDPGDITFELDTASVLYEDDYLIIVNKPAGFPSEATMVTARDHLHAAVKRYLHLSTGTQNTPYAGLMHRLDRDTSGAMIFTKKREVNAAIHDLFLTRNIHKTYEALCFCPGKDPPPSFSIENRLDRISMKSTQGKWGTVTKGGEEAITRFTLSTRYSQVIHMIAEPLTGRTHQIRVHLSEYGYPILGDSVYGGQQALFIGRTTLPVPRLMLHARSIAFSHPVSGIAMKIEAPLPLEFSRFILALAEQK